MICHQHIIEISTEIFGQNYCSSWLFHGLVFHRHDITDVRKTFERRFVIPWLLCHYPFVLLLLCIILYFVTLFPIPSLLCLWLSLLQTSSLKCDQSSLSMSCDFVCEKKRVMSSISHSNEVKARTFSLLMSQHNEEGGPKGTNQGLVFCPFILQAFLQQRRHWNDFISSSSSCRCHSLFYFVVSSCLLLYWSSFYTM